MTWSVNYKVCVWVALKICSKRINNPNTSLCLPSSSYTVLPNHHRQAISVYSQSESRHWHHLGRLGLATVCSFSPVKKFLVIPRAWTISMTWNMWHFFTLFRSFWYLAFKLARYFTWWMEIYQLIRLVIKKSIQIQYKILFLEFCRKIQVINSRFCKQI